MNDTPCSTAPLLHTCRWLLLVLACLGAVQSQAGEDGTGALVSRGEGAGATRHQLPARAIDTRDLPHTRLAVQDGDDAILPLYRIGPDTYFLYGNISTINEDNRGFNGNAGFIVTGDGVVVIDALGTPFLGRRLIATIRSVTDEPIRYLILTHNHPDHAYGASAFRDIEGIRIIGHGGMVDYLASATLEESVAYRRELLPKDMEGFEAVEPDLWVPEERFARHRIALGTRTIDVYNAGRHHSHGDLVVHQVEDGILWISDLAFNQRLTYIGDGNSQQTLEAQEWLWEHFPDARLMVPGHGSAQTPPFPMVQATHDYIREMRRRIGEQVEAGVSLMETVEQTDMAEWQDVPLYEENQRANTSFIYRELEFELF